MRTPRILLPARAVLASLTVALASVSCLVDLDDRCGEHQVYDAEGARCLCEPRYVLAGATCVPCGEHEVSSSDGCVCEEGFLRPTPDAACEENVALGAPCASDTDCADPSFGHCQSAPTADGMGYCTKAGCVAGAGDCPGPYACNTGEEPSFCERPPSGLGNECKSSSDCGSFEAGYCETVLAHSCMVNDCKADPSRCFGDWVCCDIGLLSESLCVAPSDLEDGACPGGGTLIPREAP